MKQEKWEEEFYNKFSFIQAINNEKSGNAYVRVVDYISQLLETQKKEIGGEFKKELNLYTSSIRCDLDRRAVCYLDNADKTLEITQASSLVRYLEDSIIQITNKITGISI